MVGKGGEGGGGGDLCHMGMSQTFLVNGDWRGVDCALTYDFVASANGTLVLSTKLSVQFVLASHRLDGLVV